MSTTVDAEAVPCVAYQWFRFFWDSSFGPLKTIYLARLEALHWRHLDHAALHPDDTKIKREKTKQKNTVTIMSTKQLLRTSKQQIQMVIIITISLKLSIIIKKLLFYFIASSFFFKGFWYCILKIFLRKNNKILCLFFILN